MSRRVYLHIGAPKTGTTYLQDRLALNAGEPRRATTCTSRPGHRCQPGLFHFRAALDLIARTGAGQPGHADGQLGRPGQRVRRRTRHRDHQPRDPRAGAGPSRSRGRWPTSPAARCTSSTPPATSPGRSRPSGRRASSRAASGRYRRFLAGASAAARPWFCRAFDLPDVLGTWGAGLPPERVHVVTVPQRRRAADGDLLWQRFCAASASTRPGRRSTATAPTPRSASPRPRCCASSTGGIDRATRREADVRRADPRDARPGAAGQAATRPGPAAPGALRLGRGAGRALARVARAAAASTSSATSTTCGRCRPADGRAVARPRPGPAQAAARRRARRAGRDDRGGRPPARPRAPAGRPGPRAAPRGCAGRDRVDEDTPAYAGPGAGWPTCAPAAHALARLAGRRPAAGRPAVPARRPAARAAAPAQPAGRPSDRRARRPGARPPRAPGRGRPGPRAGRRRRPARVRPAAGRPRATCPTTS